MNMLRLSIAILLAIGLWPIGWAQTAQVQLAFAEASSAQRADPADVRVDADGSPAELSREGGAVRFKMPNSASKIEVSVGGSASLAARQVTLTARALQGRRAFAIAVAKKPERFTIPFLMVGVRLLENGHFDRAVAIFELAANDETRQPSVLDEYEVILTFNLARSLHQACVKLGYDTCADAKDRMEAIAAILADKEQGRAYLRQRVTVAMVESALKEIEDLELRQKYAMAVNEVNRGDPKVGLAQLEALNERRREERRLFEAAGLSQQRLDKDIGFANTKAASNL